MPRIIYKQLSNRQGREPQQALPIESFDREVFLSASEKAKFIWYGHSVVLMRMEDKNILIDPMLGPDTTPIAPFPTKRFSENTLKLIDDFPEIDLLLVNDATYHGVKSGATSTEIEGAPYLIPSIDTLISKDYARSRFDDFNASKATASGDIKAGNILLDH